MNMATKPVSSKQMATYVLLILMSMVLSFIEVPLFGDVAWLKYDPSGIIVGLVALLFGPWQGVAVAALSWLPHAAISPLGAAMNIAASAALALVLGGVCRGGAGVGRLVLGGIGGACLAAAVSICLNFAVTPVYLSATYEQVAALVIPYLLPFNLVKAGINALLAAIAFRSLRHLLEE